MVDQARGLWYCFGACKEGGNVIKFVEKINNMNFPEACHWLADKYGIDIEDKKEEKNPEELKAIRKRASMFANKMNLQLNTFLRTCKKQKLTLHGPKSNRDGVSNILRSKVSVMHFLLVRFCRRSHQGRILCRPAGRVWTDPEAQGE